MTPEPSTEIREPYPSGVYDMVEIQSRRVTDQMALPVDALEGVKKAKTDYCTKLAKLQEANQDVPDPDGVLKSLLPGAIRGAEKDAVQCVRELERIFEEAPSVAKEAVCILRNFERRVEAIPGVGAKLVKNFGEQVEKDQDAVMKASDLTEELRDASKAVVNFECMLGAAAASVLNAFEAVTRSLDSLADGV